tara:strand:+ start:48 stop:560 length:513 start_codon:yes stop_codon:yes gene_type:complete
MKKLLILLLLPLFSFSQEDIERYKIYDTTNTYTSLLLDTATGQIWQLQIGLGKTSYEDRLKTVLSDFKYAETIEDITDVWIERIDSRMKEWEENYNSKPDSIVSAEDKAYWKPYTLDEQLSNSTIAQNGRFKLYPTGNMFNFIMVDVIDGRTWQVQWSTKKDERVVLKIY